MEPRNQPLIHLWIFNHFLETIFEGQYSVTRRLKERSFTGISDQLEFFISAVRQQGYAVSIGQQPNDSALNVVIENFSAHSRDILRDYCRPTGKRVAVIMTEHIDFISGKLFIHGEPLLNENDYMHPVTQLNRIRYLMDCLPYIRCFFTLGDLPELQNLPAMLPGIDVRTIPFPRIDSILNNDAESSDLIKNDLLFTGAMTEHRDNTLDRLKENGFSVAWPTSAVSRRRRNLMSRSSKLVLSLPQRADWRWLSLMRNIAGLRSGRATVSFGTHDVSKIAACTYQLDMRDQGWPDILRNYLGNWSSLYQTAYENYMSMASEYEQLKGFPHDMFEYWAITDQITPTQL